MTQDGHLLLEAECAGTQGAAALPCGFQCPAVANSLLAPQSPSESPRTQDNRQKRPRMSPSATPRSTWGDKLREVKGLGQLTGRRNWVSFGCGANEVTGRSPLSELLWKQL